MIAQTHQHLGFAGKHSLSEAVRAVVERPDAQRVPGCDETVPPVIIQQQGKLRAQAGEHLRSIFPIKGEEDLTIALAGKAVGTGQFPADRPKAVDFPVAHHPVPVQLKGLHPRRG